MNSTDCYSSQNVNFQSDCLRFVAFWHKVISFSIMCWDVNLEFLQKPCYNNLTILPWRYKSCVPCMERTWSFLSSLRLVGSLVSGLWSRFSSSRRDRFLISEGSSFMFTSLRVRRVIRYVLLNRVIMLDTRPKVTPSMWPCLMFSPRKRLVGRSLTLTYFKLMYLNSFRLAISELKKDFPWKDNPFKEKFSKLGIIVKKLAGNFISWWKSKCTEFMFSM